MTYWWANQNKTWKDEITNGYLWSPMKKKNGGFHKFYENMKDAKIGDTIFSYIQSEIQYIGTVSHPAVSCTNPRTSDNIQGWRVSVNWESVITSFCPTDHFDEIEPLLPEKYSPLSRKTKKGLQSVYLAEISQELGIFFLKKTYPHYVNNAGISHYIIENDIEKSIINDNFLNSTEKNTLIIARRGQGIFRQNVQKIEPCCRITKISNQNLLIASHIKPWRSSNNEERLDGYNGLFLTPHIDFFFDRGYISFGDCGEVYISPSIDAELKNMGITIPPNVGSFTPQQKKYLAYHRENIFRKI